MLLKSGCADNILMVVLTEVSSFIPFGRIHLVTLLVICVVLVPICGIVYELPLLMVVLNVVASPNQFCAPDLYFSFPVLVFVWVVIGSKLCLRDRAEDSHLELLM